MSQQSVNNRIIANIKKNTLNFDNFQNTHRVICIDSSNNRLGIGTRDPRYALDISGDYINSSDPSEYTLYSDTIIGETISGNKIIQAKKIYGNTIIGDLFDISDGYFENLSGNILDISLLYVTEISGTNYFFPDFSCNNIISNICGDFDNIIVNKITLKESGELDATALNVKVNLTRQDLENLTVGYVGKEIELSDISGRALIIDICCTNIDISNNANLYNLKVSNLADFSGITISNEAQIKDLSINGMAEFNIINVNGDANFNSTVDISSLRVDDLTNLNGDSILNNGVLEIGGDSNFNKITANTIYISNLSDSSGLLYVQDGTNIIFNTQNFKIKSLKIESENNPFLLLSDNTYFNIPIKDPFFNQNQDVISGTIFYDLSKSKLSIYEDNKKVEFAPNILFASYKDFSYNDFSNNIINNYKFIPIKNHLSNCSYFQNQQQDLSYNSIMINNSNSQITSNSIVFHEITANICVKYTNVIPGDVEANFYKFGIYKNINNQHMDFDNNSIDPDISYGLITTKNTIIAFDNSYNYANSSLTYINKYDHDISGYYFILHSNKDISHLDIESFYCKIHEL
jgi:hypothetical protein